jgi:hypothetical protein
MTQWLEFTPEFRLSVALVPPPSIPNLPPFLLLSAAFTPALLLFTSPPTHSTTNHVMQISSPLTLLVALHGMYRSSLPS